MIGTKSPEETKDYSFDWSKDIGIDVIPNALDSVWSVAPASMTIEQSSLATNGTLTTVWLMGGVTGEIYHVKNTITTTAGRVLSKVFRVLVVAENFL